MRSGGLPSFEGAVVVVTGASSGIGRAVSLRLASRGVTVIAVARRREALSQLASGGETAPGRIVPEPLDVTEEGALQRLAARVAEEHGRLDAWVNNAGVNLYGPIDAPARRDVHRVLDVNLHGYVDGILAALPHLRERGGGVVVNVSSILGVAPSPYQAAYVATKHAIHGLTVSVRQELWKDGIAVCEVAPGPVDTPLFGQAGNHMGRDVVPPSPITDPEDVAAAVIASLERPRRLRVVGLPHRITAGLARHLPRLAERTSRTMMEREHFGRSPTYATAGNLHDPDPEATTVRGGWVRPTERSVPLVGATLLTAGALALMRLRRAR